MKTTTRCPYCDKLTTVNEDTIDTGRVEIFYDGLKKFARVRCYSTEDKPCDREYQYQIEYMAYTCDVCEKNNVDSDTANNIVTMKKDGVWITSILCDCGNKYCIPTSEKRRYDALVKASL